MCTRGLTFRQARQMEAGSLESFDRQGWDRSALGMAGIDQWCSQSDWQFGTLRAFGQAGSDDLVLGNSTHLSVAFQPLQVEDGRTAFVPFDSVWGFASPVVANAAIGTLSPTEVVRAFDDFAAWTAANPDWRILAFSGLEPGSGLESYLANSFSTFGTLHVGSSTIRCAASLDGGVEGFLGRRTASFRRNLRQAARRADEHGLSFSIADDVDPDRLLKRLHRVERRSWKGREGSGIESPDMATLYDTIVRSLHVKGAVRCVFARRAGADIGFILGGVLGDTYRGLQLSYIEPARRYSVGSLLQWHEVQRLCGLGEQSRDAVADVQAAIARSGQKVMHYDLGMDMEYKRHWGELTPTTRSLLVMR